MKALVFAAGLGTRLKPLTDNLPKALAPVAGRTLLYHVITRLHEAGVSEFVVKDRKKNTDESSAISR